MNRKNDTHGSPNPDATDEMNDLFTQDTVTPAFIDDTDDADDTLDPNKKVTTVISYHQLAARRTRNQIIDETTDAYIANLNSQTTSPETISIELVQKIQDEFDLENITKGKGAKFRAPDQLSFDQIAQFMALLYPDRKSVV